MLDKTVLVKPRLVVALKLLDGGIQPDGLTQIELVAYFFQGLEHHLGPGQRVVAVGDYGVPQEMVIFHQFSPHSEHGASSLADEISGLVIPSIPDFSRKVKRREGAYDTAPVIQEIYRPACAAAQPF